MVVVTDQPDDGTSDPRTVGYLPPVTAEQAAAFFGEVEYWSSRTHRAAVDPHYDVSAEAGLPASLPAWVQVEPCPRPHLAAMLPAARSMRDHAQMALADYTRAEVPEDKAKLTTKLTGMIAEADEAVAYAEALWSPSSTDLIHQRVESSVTRGIKRYYLLGQLLGMPALLERPQAEVAVASGHRLPLPGQPGFDLWCLTDPTTRPQWQRDPAARRALEVMWSYAPDPAATLTLQAADRCGESGWRDRCRYSTGRGAHRELLLLPLVGDLRRPPTRSHCRSSVARR